MHAASINTFLPASGSPESKGGSASAVFLSSSLLIVSIKGVGSISLPWLCRNAMTASISNFVSAIGFFHTSGMILPYPGTKYLPGSYKDSIRYVFASVPGTRFAAFIPISVKSGHLPLGAEVSKVWHAAHCPFPLKIAKPISATASGSVQSNVVTVPDAVDVSGTSPAMKA